MSENAKKYRKMWKIGEKKEKKPRLENKTRLTAKKDQTKKQDEYVQGAKRLLNFFIIIYCVYWPLCYMWIS